MLFLLAQSCWDNTQFKRWRFYPVGLTCGRWTHILTALACYTTWKLRKTGSSTPPFYTPESLEGSFRAEHNQRTCWETARTSEHPACALASTLQVITTVKYHSCHLRVYSWRCPTKQMDSGEFALSSHPKPSKKQSAAHAVEAKSYRTHIICARGLALPSGLVLQNSGCRTGWCHWQF